MAKRFYDSETFRRPQMRELSSKYKLLLMYLLCECDHAGVWDVEIDVASLRLGAEYTMEDARDHLRGIIYPLADGTKWFIPMFLEQQYGQELSSANRVHVSALKILSNHDLCDHPLVAQMIAEGRKEREPKKPKKRISRDQVDQAVAEAEANADKSISRGPATPYAEIAKLYNVTLESKLGAVFGNTYDRRKKMDDLFEYVKCDIKFIRRYFERVAKSKFLTGRSRTSDFKATFDWLLNVDHYVRTMEGQYDNERRK